MNEPSNQDFGDSLREYVQSLQERIKELEENAANNAHKNKIRALEKERECKICMDKEVGVVFIPCGHIACCVDCGESFSYCPICRREIELKNLIFTP